MDIRRVFAEPAVKSVDAVTNRFALTEEHVLRTDGNFLKDRRYGNFRGTDAAMKKQRKNDEQRENFQLHDYFQKWFIGKVRTFPCKVVKSGQTAFIEGNQ